MQLLLVGRIECRLYLYWLIKSLFLGASSGIGAATAILFSKLGASLVLSGRNENAIDATIQQCDEASKSRVKFI